MIPQKKTVVIVEDDLRLQQHLIEIIKAAEDITLLGAVSSAEEAEMKIPALQPDVVLMDINLPGKSGIDCIRGLKKRLPKLEVVMLTAYEEEDSAHIPWAVWENRILVRASNPDEALRRTMEHLSDLGNDYTNPDGVLLRDTVVGLTSLIPIYDSLEDGNEIEWIDHTGETVMDMFERIRDNSKLEAFTIPDRAKNPQG